MNAPTDLNLRSHLAWPILCAAACMLCIQPALAADAESYDVPAVRVYFGDLNLQRPASIAALYRRIQRAAERVCERPNGRAVQQIYAAKKCAEQAIDRAVASIDMPALAQYAARSKARASETTG